MCLEILPYICLYILYIYTYLYIHICIQNYAKKPRRAEDFAIVGSSQLLKNPLTHSQPACSWAFWLVDDWWVIGDWWLTIDDWLGGNRAPSCLYPVPMVGPMAPEGERPRGAKGGGPRLGSKGRIPQGIVKSIYDSKTLHFGLQRAPRLGEQLHALNGPCT